MALLLLFRLIPLYLIMGLGYIAARYLRADRETIGTLLIYVIAPVVVFHGAFTSSLDAENLSLPIVFYFICCSISLATFRATRGMWQDNTRHILGFTAGSGNTGYFGLPVAIALFGHEATAPMVLGSLGFLLFENSLGFYLTARGKFSVQESLVKLVRLPTLYAFAAGLVCNIAGLKAGEIYQSTVDKFIGCYSVLGMMLIGLGLEGLRRVRPDFRFVAASFIVKFLVWPLAVVLLIAIDNLTANIYPPSIERIMILLAIVPLAANTVAFATKLDAQPEKAALAVFLSTLFALFFIPSVLGLFPQ